MAFGVEKTLLTSKRVFVILFLIKALKMKCVVDCDIYKHQNKNFVTLLSISDFYETKRKKIITFLTPVRYQLTSTEEKLIILCFSLFSSFIYLKKNILRLTLNLLYQCRWVDTLVLITIAISLNQRPEWIIKTASRIRKIICFLLGPWKISIVAF